MLNAHEHHKIIHLGDDVTDTRTARRKLLVDRWTEMLTEAGDPHAADRARQFLAPMDDLGFDLPTTLDDPPPLRPAHIASPETRQAALADIRAVLAARNT